MKHSKRENVFFMGDVMLSRSVRLSFLKDVQLTFVAPVNEVVRGKITNEKGEIIRKGDVLARAKDYKEKILVNICSQKLKKAKQALKDSSLNLKRIKKLYKRHVFSERQHEEAENDYLQAVGDFDVCRLQLLEAKEDLDDKELRAPFSGIIEKVFASAGSSLADDEPVLVLSVFDPVCVTVKLHDVLTDLLCVDNQFQVYPTGFTKSYPGWLKTQEIFTDYIELSVKNYYIPKRILTPEQKKLPKIYTRIRVKRFPELPEIKLWVPREALRKDKEGDYVWIADGNKPHKACTKTAPVFKVKKIRVKPMDKFIQKRSARYQALATDAKLSEAQIVLVKTDDDLVDGGMAVMLDSCWLFQPTERVWVSIPELARHLYVVFRRFNYKYS